MPNIKQSTRQKNKTIKKLKKIRIQIAIAKYFKENY